jgi:hypothetical protein
VSETAVHLQNTSLSTDSDRQDASQSTALVGWDFGTPFIPPIRDAVTGSGNLDNKQLTVGQSAPDVTHQAFQSGIASQDVPLAARCGKNEATTVADPAPTSNSMCCPCVANFK